MRKLALFALVLVGILTSCTRRPLTTADYTVIVNIEIEKEIVLLLEVENKSYILFKDIEGNNKKIYASYFMTEELENDAVNLYNDLSEEEYQLLENSYKKGREIYDREN